MTYSHKLRLKLWTSDPSIINFDNRIIRTTSQNTVLDIKNVIWKRSEEQILEAEEQQKDIKGTNKDGCEATSTATSSTRFTKLLHPKIIKVLYKNSEHLDNEKLESFILEQDIKYSGEFVSIQIALTKDSSQSNKTQISGNDVYTHSDYKDPLANINLIYRSEYSNFNFSTRESIYCTISSLKYFILDELHRKSFDGLKSNSVKDILISTHPKTKTQELDEQASLSDIYLLDTLPVSNEFNLYFQLDLSENYITTVNENLVEFRLLSSNVAGREVVTEKIKVDSNLNVKDIKLKIISIQNPTKLPNLTVDDIKVIFLGQVLTNDESIKEAFKLLGHKPPTYPINLHFLISADYMLRHALLQDLSSEKEESIWEQIKNGRAFEFLPKEEDIVYSDEEYYEQNGVEGATTGSLLQLMSSNSNTMPETLASKDFSASYETVVKNRPPVWDDYVLEGTSFNLLLSQKKKEYYVVDQRKHSTKLIEISLTLPNGNIKMVTLSTSQAIVNKTNLNAPYLILSPSGIAEITKLGVNIEPPKIVLSNSISKRQQDLRYTPTPTTISTDLSVTHGTNESSDNLLNQNTARNSLAGNYPRTNINHDNINNFNDNFNNFANFNNHNNNLRQPLTLHSMIRNMRNFNIGEIGRHLFPTIMLLTKYIFVLCIVIPELYTSGKYYLASFAFAAIIIIALVREVGFRRLEQFLLTENQPRFRATLLPIVSTIRNVTRNSDWIYRILRFCCDDRAYQYDNAVLEDFIYSLDESEYFNQYEAVEESDENFEKMMSIKKETLEFFKKDNRRQSSFKNFVLVIFKDILLFFLTLFPPLYDELKEIMLEQRQDLRSDLIVFYRTLAHKRFSSAAAGNENNEVDDYENVNDNNDPINIDNANETNGEILTGTGFSRAGTESIRSRRTHRVIDGDTNINSVENGDNESDDGTTVSDGSDLTVSDPLNNTSSDTDTEDRADGSF